MSQTIKGAQNLVSRWAEPEPESASSTNTNTTTKASTSNPSSTTNSTNSSPKKSNGLEASRWATADESPKKEASQKSPAKHGNNYSRMHHNNSNRPPQFHPRGSADKEQVKRQQKEQQREQFRQKKLNNSEKLEWNRDNNDKPHQQRDSRTLKNSKNTVAAATTKKNASTNSNIDKQQLSSGTETQVENTNNTKPKLTAQQVDEMMERWKNNDFDWDDDDPFEDDL